ncbi:sodium-dependent transporter, partial [Candidatus Micrarchaeota archaeon]|nr:sodium-dependent transporter [Candidatus Micrarchaeota archaeon]
FLIPYLISVFIIGLPLMILETGAGQKLKKSLPNYLNKDVLGKISWLPIIMGLVILSYYIVITGWVLFQSINLPLSSESSFIQGAQPLASIPISLLIVGIAFTVAISGLHRGLEKTLNVLIPLFLVGLLALFLFSVSQPGNWEQVTKIFTPDFSKILDGKTWLFAMSQAIFSLSIGYTILYCYGAYLGTRKSLATSLFIVAFADTLVALISVGTTLPVALASGEASGFSLSFDSTLSLFARMPSGIIFGSIFFFLLFLAAFTSIISMFETPLFTIQDYFKTSRKKAAAITALVLTPLIVFSAYSYAGVNLLGKPAIETIDLVFGSLLAPFSVLILLAIFTFKLDIEKLLNESSVPKKLVTPTIIATRIAIAIMLVLGVIGLLEII